MVLQRQWEALSGIRDQAQRMGPHKPCGTCCGTMQGSPSLLIPVNRHVLRTLVETTGITSDFCISWQQKQFSKSRAQTLSPLPCRKRDSHEVRAAEEQAFWTNNVSLQPHEETG